MSQSYLACTVRGCGLPLERAGRAFACSAGHSYDVGRSGYVNLLQPQDRRSRTAGDARAAVDARARLIELGIGRATLDALVRRAAALELGDDPVVVDVGSGTGHLLAALARARHLTGTGIDLSVSAAEHAARRAPHLSWVVANADRRLPLLDHSVRLILSQHARRNPAECARALVPGGYLLMAIPAPDDLLQLRAVVGGEPVERDRGARLVAEHAAHFAVIDRFIVRDAHRLDPPALALLLRSTYRGERRSMSNRVETIAGMEVTVASELILFRSALPGESGHSRPAG